MRDEVESKGDSRAVEYMREENPRVEGEMSLRPRRNALGQYFGFGNIHPGSAATDLANLPYNTDVHGFRITGSMSIVMGNPKRAMGDDGVTITQPFKIMPFVKSAAAIAAMAA